MSGAANHRGTSKQDYETPWEFMDAVERRFGKPTWDLAASPHNTKADQYFSEAIDSLSDCCIWDDGLLWLNPPFSDIAPWAEKCAIAASRGAKILFLTPASVDSNWWKNFVHGKAWSEWLSPRISFDGKNPFPKPMALSCYNICGIGSGPWRWKI